MTEPELLLLWGKTCRESKNPDDLVNRYHPVAFHLLDVANCTLALWDTFLSEAWKKRIADAFDCDVATARILVAFLAGVHDLGKASPIFQFQETPLDWLRERLKAVGLTKVLSKQNLLSKDYPHNFISSKELNTFWMDDLWRWKARNKRVAPVLANITGAHHGTFPNSPNFASYNEDVMGDKNWSAVRLELLDLLAIQVCPPDFVFPPTTKWQDVGSIPFLAGLISVADWIGSSQHFELEGRRNGTMSFADYAPLSESRAKLALNDFGFASAPEFTAPLRDFQEFWGFKPNPLQKAILKQTKNLAAPFLLICEAPMGSGKSEGAFCASDAAFTAKVNEGFYIALPTQATSNAMHKRTKKFLDKRLPEGAIHLQLVHGNAGLSEAPNVVFQPLSEIYDDLQNDTERARVMALSWFTGAKRPLLAPFGVGTIDQSLLGALQTRHYFVRLFALAGKVVVFDEVHSYDTYMSELLNTLLHWLRELGCSVILLSATLPSGKRQELVQAWGANLPLKEAEYPRLTWCGDGTNTESVPIVGAEMAPKTIKVSRLKTEELARELREKLKDGGCAAIICNTVADAQAIFETLRTEFAAWIKPEYMMLFHARLPFKWRKAREDKILELFGKEKVHRPERAIVVATQVLEQSLDIDFDWMASFMAPSDLLLQRVGRLHRHTLDENEQPLKRYGLDKPQLAILTDTEGDALPHFGDSEFVYEREVLLRSWLLWRNKKVLKLPAEIEKLIEDTYQNPPAVPNETWSEALKAAKAAAENERETAIGKAVNVVVNLRTGEGNLRAPVQIVEAPTLDLKDDDDPKIHQALRAKTRDSDGAVTVICLCKVGEKYYLPAMDGTPDLQSPIDLKAKVQKPQAKKLMDYAVSLSQKGLYHELIAEPVPPTWKDSAFLRHIRPLYFENGTVKVGNRTMHLDGDLGIVIEKEKREAK